MNLFCYRSLWSWGLFNVWLLLTDSLVSLKRKLCCDEEDIAKQCPVAKIRVYFNAFRSWEDEPSSTKHSSTRLKKTIKNWCKWSFFGLFSLLSVLTVFKRSIISYHTPCTTFSLPPLSLSPSFPQTDTQCFHLWSISSDRHINQKRSILTGLAQKI